MQLNCPSEKHRTCLKAKCAFPVPWYRAPGRGCGWQRSPGTARALQKSFVTSVPFLCCAAVQSHPSVSHLSCAVKAAAIPPLSIQGPAVLSQSRSQQPWLRFPDLCQALAHPGSRLCNARALSLPLAVPSGRAVPVPPVPVPIPSLATRTPCLARRQIRARNTFGFYFCHCCGKGCEICRAMATWMLSFPHAQWQ